MPEVMRGVQGTEVRDDSLSEDGKDWNTGSWKGHVDGAGCFVEKAQSTRLTWGRRQP